MQNHVFIHDVLMVIFLLFFQNHAPADLYLMTTDPKDSPNDPDQLEIEFKNGLCPLC